MDESVVYSGDLEEESDGKLFELGISGQHLLDFATGELSYEAPFYEGFRYFLNFCELVSSLLSSSLHDVILRYILNENRGWN